MARAALLEHVPVGSVHRIEGERGAAEAAARYQAELRRQLGQGAFPALDLVLLGLGTDGHTASLFPGSPALLERTRWAVAAPGPPPSTERITLTVPVLERARAALFLVVGADKAEPLRQAAAAPPGREARSGGAHPVPGRGPRARRRTRGGRAGWLRRAVMWARRQGSPRGAPHVKLGPGRTRRVACPDARHPGTPAAVAGRPGRDRLGGDEGGGAHQPALVRAGHASRGRSCWSRECRSRSRPRCATTSAPGRGRSSARSGPRRAGQRRGGVRRGRGAAGQHAGAPRVDRLPERARTRARRGRRPRSPGRSRRSGRAGRSM